MKPTIRELSKLIGYSPATISNALNHKAGVKGETLEKILEAARYYGYLEEKAASKIRFVIYKESGLLTEDISSMNQLLDGVQSECKNLGFEIHVQHLDRSEDGFEKKVKEILSDQSSGVILVGGEISEQNIPYFRDAQTPLVILGSWDDSIKGVGIIVDCKVAIEQAVDVLVSCGHQRIGYLKSGIRVQVFESIERGYYEGMEKNHLPCKPGWTLEFPDMRSTTFEKCVNEFARKGEMPTAFVSDTDIVAFGVMAALKKNWINVPNAVSVIGFSDTPYAEVSSPSLSSFRIPYREMGIMAVKQIDEMMKKKINRSLKMSFRADLIQRESIKNFII